MKKILFLFWFSLSFLIKTASIHGQVYEGSTDIDKYLKEIIAPSFGVSELNNETDKKDFKKLREFYRKKSDLLTALTDTKESYQDYSDQIRIQNRKKNNIENLIKDQKTDKVIDVNYELTVVDDIDNLSYLRLRLLDNVVPRPESKKKVTVSDLKEVIDKISDNIVKLQEKTNAFRNLEVNISNVKQDIYNCNSQIDSTLAPEYQQQSFRIWISVTFTILIAILLIIFFYIVYKKSDNTLSKELLSGNGLQFITLFVLIIAIILFGILNILGGSELATILSGISGYILGKGINASRNNKDDKINNLSN